MCVMDLVPIGTSISRIARRDMVACDGQRTAMLERVSLATKCMCVCPLPSYHIHGTGHAHPWRVHGQSVNYADSVSHVARHRSRLVFHVGLCVRGGRLRGEG